MSKFTFSILIVLYSLTSLAQEISTQTRDSVPLKKERYGLRLGVDLYKPIRSLYDKNYNGLELVGDYRITRRHYLAAEIGNENKTVEEQFLNFTTNGNYLKVGFDYNTYENWGNMENMIYFGFRYGVSSFSQNLNHYEIYNTNHYFNEGPVIYTGQKYSGLSAQWLEVVAGVKVEVLKNVFAGFSFRLNRLLTQSKPNNFDNLYIPGFNKTYGGNYGIGFNYSVSYFIPLYKSTVKPKEKK